jgi:hypothetical protein
LFAALTHMEDAQPINGILFVSGFVKFKRPGESAQSRRLWLVLTVCRSMTAALLVPFTEAAAFTVGCVLIHTQRQHADRLTGVLVLVAFALCLGIVFTVTPAEVLNASAIAEVASSVPLTE